MAKTWVLYKNPKNAEAFDQHYSSVHVPLARKIPGLKKHDISIGAIGPPAGPSGAHTLLPLYILTSLTPSKPAWHHPRGRPGDLTNFADGGVELYFFDTKEV